MSDGIHTDAAGGGTRLGAVAARLGLTEGQAYTVVILLVVAVVLASSLTDLTGRLRSLAGPIAGAAPEVTTPPPASSTTVTLPPVTGSDFVSPGLPSTTVPPMPTTSTSTPDPITPEPFDPLVPEDEEKVPCPAQGAVDGVRDVTKTLDTLLGGVTPNQTLVSVVAIATGCSAQDPAILLLAALIEIGQDMPDLGLGELIEIPQLPFLAIPDLIIDLVQPARQAIDGLCEAVGTANVLTSQIGPHYQAPIDAIFSVSLFYALATCGQLQSR